MLVEHQYSVRGSSWKTNARAEKGNRGGSNLRKVIGGGGRAAFLQSQLRLQLWELYSWWVGLRPRDASARPDLQRVPRSPAARGRPPTAGWVRSPPPRAGPAGAGRGEQARQEGSLGWARVSPPGAWGHQGSPCAFWDPSVAAAPAPPATGALLAQMTFLPGFWTL